MICLQVNQLTKQYGMQTVVDGLTFQLEENSATALIGPNGAGKTTTLSMLTGLLQPTSGTIAMPNVLEIRAKIGFLPQYPQFQGWLSAIEYVEMCARLSGVPAREAKQRAQKMLEFVGLGADLKKKTSTFSGGMKQRLGIAQAIVHNPKLILLDEPVSALDPVGRRQMMDLLKELQQTTTILYSTHILNDAEQMTDQVLFLQRGKLVEQGSIQEVRSRYNEPKILVEFAREDQAKVFAQGFINGTTQKERSIYIEVKNEVPTMQQVIQRLNEHSFDVVKVEKVMTSLEEIFMKVAQKQ